MQEEALAQMRQEDQVLGGDRPGTIVAIRNLAIIYEELGEFEAALRLHEEALTKWRRCAGDGRACADMPFIGAADGMPWENGPSRNRPPTM